MWRGVVLGVLLAGPAASQVLDDRHLSVIPRTSAETARIAKVLQSPAARTVRGKIRRCRDGTGDAHARCVFAFVGEPSL
jgi:hypothetical protein